MQQQQLQAQASGLSGPQGSGFSGEREQETNGRAHSDSPTQMQGSVAPSTPVPSASMPYMQVGSMPACQAVGQECGAGVWQAQHAGQLECEGVGAWHHGQAIRC